MFSDDVSLGEGSYLSHQAPKFLQAKLRVGSIKTPLNYSRQAQSIKSHEVDESKRKRLI